MTERTELTSQDIRDGIAKAQSELDQLTPVIADVQVEQRKLAALATVGMLTAAKAARQVEVNEELYAMQVRQSELKTGIEGARELLEQALEAERIAAAQAGWDNAEQLLAKSQEVAVAAQKALEEAGALYAELDHLLKEAADSAKPHMQTVGSRSQLDANPLHLGDLFGLVLKDAGGPNFDRDVPYVARPGRAPTIESVIAGHVRRFMSLRDR